MKNILLHSLEKESLEKVRHFFNIKENARFLFFSIPGITLPSFGWKIHISGTIHNFRGILSLVIMECLKSKVSFKCIKNYEILKKSLMPSGDRYLSGKFITIYPKGQEEFFKFIEILHLILLNFKGPWIYTDNNYKTSSVIFYRHGIFKKNENFGKFSFDKSNGVTCTQNKGNPFKNKRGKLNLKINNKYIPIKFISKNNAGANILSKDFKDNYILIKERRFGILFNERENVQDYLKKEFINSKLIGSKVEIPAVYDIFYEGSSLFICKEWIEGKNMYSQKLEDKMPFPNDKYIKIIINLLLLLENFHKNSWIMNDIKLDNFIYTPIKKIYFIDLEHCYKLGEVGTHVEMRDISKMETIQKKALNNPCYSDKIKMAFLIIKLTSAGMSDQELSKKELFGEKLVSKFENETLIKDDSFWKEIIKEMIYNEKAKISKIILKIREKYEEYIK